MAGINAAGQGPWSTSSDAIVCRAPPLAPKITSDLSIRDMTVIAGQEFKITVPFIGNPMPKPTWTINGLDVDQDERIKFDTNKTSTQFINKSAKRSETGVYTIHLHNSEGTDSATCRVLIVDRPSPPQGPLDVCDITPDTCTLSWKTPLDDGGSAITNYIVEKLDANGIWVKVSSFVRTNHYDCMGLEANKKYYFRVRAENQYGISEPLTRDDAVLATYPFTVPDPPGAPKIIDYDATNVKLIWDRPRSDGGSRIQGYKIEYRDVADTQWQIHDILIKDNSYQLYNLTTGCEYEFRVRAKNAAGFSKPSAPSSKLKLRGKFNVPGAPGTPNVIKVGKNYVDLHWDKPITDGGSRITGYIIERRDIGGAIWVKCNDYNVIDTDYTVLNLIEGSDYEFRVFAVNAAGRSEPSTCTMPIKICECIGGTKPDWIRKLTNYCVPLGKYITLECEAMGKPIPTARWLKNGREICLGEHFKTDMKDGIFRLHILDAKLGDDGDYTCEALNSLGFVHTTGRLRIGTPPRIDRIPSELYLTETDNKKIKIYYSGDQPLDIKLKQNGQNIDNNDQHIKYTLFDDYIVICIKDIQKTDAGTYQIELTNDSGSVQGQFMVYITGLPGPPIGPLDISEITRHSCTLTWKPPTIDGGLRITHYVVERKDITLSHWIVVSSFTKDCQFTVQGLAENQEYIFRIMAVNDNGIGPPLDGVNSIRAKAPYDPPSKPGTPTVSEIGDDFVHLEWTKPESDGGARIQGKYCLIELNLSFVICRLSFFEFSISCVFNFLRIFCKTFRGIFD